MLQESSGLGLTTAQLETLMDIIEKAASESPGPYGIDPDKFEQIVNPQVSKYGIEFTRSNEFLNRHHAPACTLLGGVVVRTPQVNSPAYFHQLKTLLSHELVHKSQIDRAIGSGNAYKMMASSQKRFMPGGHLDKQKYMTDKHEIGAYARTALDSAGLKSKDKAVSVLRRKKLPWLSQEPEGSDLWKRSRKNAYKHATTALESLLENELEDFPDETNLEVKLVSGDQRADVLLAKGYTKMRVLSLESGIEYKKGETYVKQVKPNVFYCAVLFDRDRRTGELFVRDLPKGDSRWYHAKMLWGTCPAEFAESLKIGEDMLSASHGGANESKCVGNLDDVSLKESIEDVPEPAEVLPTGETVELCPQCQSDLQQPESVIRLYRHHTEAEDEPSCSGHYEGLSGADKWIPDQDVTGLDLHLFYEFTDACADCGSKLQTKPVQKY